MENIENSEEKNLKKKNKIFKVGMDRNTKVINMIFITGSLCLLYILMFQKFTLISCIALLILIIFDIIAYFDFSNYVVIKDGFLCCCNNRKKITKKIKISDIFDIKSNFFTSKIYVILANNKKVNILTFAPMLICYIIVLGIIFLPFFYNRFNYQKLYIFKLKNIIGLPFEKENVENPKLIISNIEKSIKVNNIICWILNVFFIFIILVFLLYILLSLLPEG